MLTVILFSLLAFSFAGYPVDFDRFSPRAVGSPFWLPEGTYEADVAGRTDLTSAFLELHLQANDPDVECFWSLQLDGAKVDSGVFTSPTPSVIAILSNTIPTGETLTLWASGCTVGRYATPFNLGDNSGGVYLVDVTPTTQEAIWAANGNLNIPNTNVLDATHLEQTPNQGSNGLCKFSNAACNQAAFAPTANSTYWTSTDSHVYIDWSASTDIQTTDEVVIETNFWLQNYGQVSYYLCNVSLDCKTDAGNYIQQTVSYGVPDYSFYNFLPGSAKKRFSGPDPFLTGTIKQGTTMNSTRIFTRHMYNFDPTVGDVAPSVAVRFSQPVIPFPYVKVWGLAGGYTTNPIHQIIDLRSGLNPECTTPNINPLTGQVGYPEYGCYDSGAVNPAVYELSETFPTVLGETNQTAWFWCGNLPEGASFGADEPDTDCATTGTLAQRWTTLNLTTTVQTNVTLTGFELPDGGFLTPSYFDWGIPCVFSTVCTSGATALNQLSYFDVIVDGTTVGTQRQFFVDRFDTQSVKGFGVDGYVMGANPRNIKLQSLESFSILTASFIPVTAFPTPVCDNLNCSNDGFCTNPDSNPNCTCTEGWTGPNCDELAQLCPADSSIVCKNGGTCQENPARTIVDGVWVDLYTCNCSGTSVDTGDFYGQYCEFPPACDQYPCLHDGECVNLGQDQFECNCSNTVSVNSTTPYTGVLCETSSRNACDSNPCQNSGTCTADSSATGGFSCDCQNGWTGSRCNLPPVDSCQPGDCEPLGVCTSGFNTATLGKQCVCLYGYSGADCKTPPDVCVEDPEYCMNGGVCVGLFGADIPNAGCLCSEPWVGQQCQWNSSMY